ncbi:branched-chain amino acid ABC transporter permease [Solirhodobacter olei]|uniref:branched-chain amino acid ABC transporter permease n=1 Tax=Solirhodobacter olei TaxID=2493082 RepID=UPI000FD6E57A|nr:branched-chain amino acid ABC transporter permease [Solirhodobacter olei]
MQHPNRLWIVYLARAALFAAAVVMAVAPMLLATRDIAILTEFLSLLTIAIMWNLLAGYADIVSVGQHAFVGVGAYALFGFAAIAHVDPYLAIPLSALVALVVALPVMVIIFRLRTAYLAVGSWVVAETIMLAAGKLSAFGGGSGISLPVSVVRGFGSRVTERYATIYWIAFAVAALALVATWLLMRSRIGLGLTAMRDNEEGAGVVGVNLIGLRVLCFLWTAPFLGLAGAVITLQKLRVSPPASFSIIDWTVYVIFIVVIGGIGSFEGPIIGTVVFFLIREYLSEIGVWHFIILGVLSIAVVLIEPRGLWGLVRRLLPADVIPISRRRRVRR